MASSGFLEKWIGICRRRRTTSQSYSQLVEEDPPESETGIEEEGDGGGLVEIVVDILPKDKPGSGIRSSPINKLQKWYESKARLMKLGFRWLQNRAGVRCRGTEGSFHLEGGDDLESQTRIREHEFVERSLPDEIVLEILVRVNFKTLLRCRCVCKRWRSFISQPYFVKMLLLKNHNSTNDYDGIGDYVIFSNKEMGFSELHFHSLCGYGCVTKKLQLPIEPSLGVRHFVPSGAENFLPYGHFANRISLLDLRVVGSCNGLLCLFSLDGIFLWNPALNKMRVVEETQMGSSFTVVGGLCFIPQTMDFKVVKIGLLRSQVKIFSTSTNSWKNVAENNTQRWMITQKCPAPFVEGSLHWCVDQRQRKQFILCFDVLEEKFHEIDAPVDKEIAKITEFRGRIACFIDDPINQSWEVWVMDVYGVEDSWINLYTFGYVHGIPQQVMNDGEVMLTNFNGGFFLFDPTTQIHGKEVEVKPGCRDMVAYKGSLALLNEGNQSRYCLCCCLMFIAYLNLCFGLFGMILSFLYIYLSD